jgi:FKBP-type peptidyl-prolyl cis-trans isomerase (trigger factor)
MQITTEETGAMTASIKVQINKDDYEEKVTKTLKEYQHKANMPGFRPGKVPFGLISKMYRKGIMLDEINHMMSDHIQKYIEENKLRLIHSPIPDREKSANIDLDLQSEFEFFFDIGFIPEFSLDLSDNLTVDTYTITATDKMIDDQIHDIQHRVAHQDHPEHEHHEHSEDHHEDESHHEELPELDENFYNRVFPGQDIKDESAFRAKIKESLEHSLAQESERFFLNSAMEKLVNETKFDLPEDFLKKMLKENNENKLTEEQIDAQFSHFVKSVRWQLIESRLIHEHGVSVEENEVRNFVMGYFTGGKTIDEVDPEQEERLNKIVDSVLSSEEEYKRIYDQLFDKKLLDFLKTNLKQVNKEVDYDQFIKIITEKKD